MEAAHKNTQTLKRPEPTVGTLGKLHKSLSLLFVGNLQVTVKRSILATVAVGLAI